MILVWLSHPAWQTEQTCANAKQERSRLRGASCAVATALVFGSSPVAMARTQVRPHANDQMVVHRSFRITGTVIPFPGKATSGDAWVYDNNHYLQMLPRR